MKTGKNDDLQCLRAVAILLVLMQHARNRLPTPQWYGKLFEHFSFWPGVDIFFAISGFLICHSFVRQLSRAPHARDAWIEFWIRRLFRLLPAVVFWMAFCVAIAPLVTASPGGDVVKVGKGAVAALFGVSNAYWVYCVQSATQACGNADFNGVTWSLSLEWQLYAVLTVLVGTFGKKPATIVMLAVAAGMSCFAAPSFSVPWAFRMQAFALGAMTFVVLSKNDELPTIALPGAAAIVMLVVGVFVCIASPNLLPQPYVLPAIAVGSLLCLVSTLGSKGFSRSRMAAPFVWIGERSYSIYLCHLPMLLLTREIMSRRFGLEPDAWHVAIGLAIAVCLIATCANYSYRFIELPFQEHGRTLLSRRRRKKGAAAVDDHVVT